MSRARHLKSGGAASGDKDEVQGGKVPGAAVMKQADAPAHGFKRGGHKKKDGGPVEGMKAGGRLDKAPRKASGGPVTMRGRSPYSSASRTESAPGAAGKDNH